MSGRHVALSEKNRPVGALVGMCEQCKEIDAKIEHYRRVAERIADEQTIAGLNDLIRDLLRKRAALHSVH